MPGRLELIMTFPRLNRLKEELLAQPLVYLVAPLLGITIALADYRVSLGPLVFYPPELLVYFLGIFAVSNRTSRLRLVRAWRDMNVEIKIAIYLIIAGALIGTLISPLFPQSIGAFKAWIVAPILLMILLVAYGNPRTVLATVFVLGLLMVARGLVEIYHLGLGIRLSGYYESPNYFSALAAPITLIAFWSARERRSWAWLILGIALTIMILLTRSFGGLLGMLVAVVVLWFYLSKKEKTALVLAAAILCLLVVPSFSSRFSQGGNSFDSRLEIWKASSLMLADVPLTGMGLRGFEHRYPTYISRVTLTPLQWDAAQPHNLALAIWLGLGILGLLGFIKLFWQILHFEGEPNAFVLAMIVILGHGLVDTPYFRTDLAMVFWLYVVGIFLMKTSRKSGESC